MTFAFDCLVCITVLLSYSWILSSQEREWEENVSLVDTAWLWLCCLVHPACVLSCDHSLFMLVSQGIEFWEVFRVQLVAMSESLVLNLGRENRCGGIMVLTVPRLQGLSISLSVCPSLTVIDVN